MTNFLSRLAGTKATFEVSHEEMKVPIPDTRAEAQRLRLLARLEREAVDTLALRREENILAPASRIAELRQRGHRIVTTRVVRNDDQGRRHRNVALYTLLPIAARA